VERALLPAAFDLVLVFFFEPMRFLEGEKLIGIPLTSIPKRVILSLAALAH
jgi:hypothetical protein